MAVQNTISFKVVRPAPEFEQIPNDIICKADALTLGVYVKLIHLAPSWKKISIARIATALGLSIARVRFAITWVEREGYLVRAAIQDKSGKMTGWQYTLFGNRVGEDERSNAGYANFTVLSKNRQDGKPSSRKTDKTENDNSGEKITDNSLSNGSDNIIYKNISHKEEKIDKEEKTRKEENEQKESLGHIVTDERYLPAMSEWLEYKREKRQTYKPRGLKACYSRLVSLSNGDPQVALEKVVRFSISNNYTGLFRENEMQAQKKNMSEQFLDVNERFNMDEYEDY